jgi:hypothetical protein
LPSITVKICSSGTSAAVADALAPARLGPAPGTSVAPSAAVPKPACPPGAAHAHA